MRRVLFLALSLFVLVPASPTLAQKKKPAAKKSAAKKTTAKKAAATKSTKKKGK